MENNEALDEVLLIDEDGQETRFHHVLTFLHEGERYVALEPAQEEDNPDEAEIVLLRVTSDKDQDSYVSIDNEVLLDEVFGVFLDLMEEIEEEPEKD